MMKKLRVAALAALACVGVSAALGAGVWSNWPIVGGSSYCSAIVGSSNVQAGTTGQGTGGIAGVGSNGVYCAQTVPQGPAYSGEEMIPADTYGTNGGQPTTSALMPSVLAGSLNERVNRIIGGDFATNLWQRGTSLSGSSPNSAIMSADRWYQYSTGNITSISKQTGAADTLPSAQIQASMRIQRPSGSNTTSINVGQVMDNKASKPLLGSNMVCSFYALAGAGFSASNSAIAVTEAYYTAADSTAPLTNTQAFAAASITGYQAVTAGLSPGFGTGTIASGVATIPISTTWTRYSVYGAIPTANAAGTTVTGVGLNIGYTPVGSAAGVAGATDYFEIADVQCQAMPSAVTAQLPVGVISPTGMERRAPAIEQVLEQYYSYVLTDTADTTSRFGFCQVYTTGLAHCVVQYPVAMREVPTTAISVANSFAATNATGTAQACGTLTVTSQTQTVLETDLTCNPNASNFTAAGNAALFTGNNTTGIITWAAEP